MQIDKDTVVMFEYTLKSTGGEVLDASEGEPLAYMHGYEQIVPGLERAMSGRKAGEAFDIALSPDEGYGERDEEAIFEIERNRLPKDLDPEVGMELASRTPDGDLVRIRLVEVTDDKVTADANHPLAGQTLHFSVKIVDVRAATGEELQHGHVHGCGCDH